MLHKIDIVHIHLVLSEFHRYFLSPHLIVYERLFWAWQIWARMEG